MMSHFSAYGAVAVMTATADCASRDAGRRATAGRHRPQEAGVDARRRRRVLGSAPARERARQADAPATDRPPPFRAAIGLVVLPVSVHAFALGHRASSCAASGLRPGAGVPEARP